MTLRCSLLFSSLLGAIFAAPAWCQSPDTFGTSPDAPSGREITIELDTARGRNAEKSLGLALLGSAVLPGAGELYLGEDRSAKSFLLAEAGFWAGLFVAWQTRGSYMQSARNYASEYAGADASGWGETMLERAAAYRASHREEQGRNDSYELSYVLTYHRELEVDHPNHPHWDFGSSNTPENTARWREYQSIMRHYRGAKIGMSFAIGALALNRVASAAHTLRAYRRTSGKGLGYRFDPLFSPDGSGARLSVTF